jgi:hypothetical protein
LAEPEKDLFEVRKLRTNGHGGWVLNIPPQIVRAMKRPIVYFEIKDGEVSFGVIED